MKKISTIILAVLLFTQFLTGSASIKAQQEPLRLHVIANSNTKEDQAAKLKVRDDLLAYSGEAMENVQDMQQAKAYIAGNLDKLTDNANKVLRENGFDYKARVSIGESYFPEKQYGDKVYPAGKYQAVQIVLGDGKGDNWWCVIFPPLCIVAVNNDDPDAYTYDPDAYTYDRKTGEYVLKSKDDHGKIQYKSIFAGWFNIK